MSLLLTKVNRGFVFSEDALLREGSIIIFAITLTISVLIDFYVLGYEYRNNFIRLMFNAVLPLLIIVFGMMIHLITVFTNSEALQASFVLPLDVSITICAVLFCMTQKVVMVYNANRDAAS